MFKASEITPIYANLLGWKQHFDTTDISIPVELTETESGEYYQQKHPALQLDVIQAVLPRNYPLGTFLKDMVTDSTNEMLNDLLQYRKVSDYGKSLLEKSTLLNRYGWANDIIPNKNRFVGMAIKLKSVTGLQLVIEEIGLQFNNDETFKLYLFHSSKSEPLEEIDVTTSSNGWNWQATGTVLSAFKDLEYHGGTFILGYYQEDIAVQAINYSNFNWNRGVCGSCNNSGARTWQSIKRYFTVHPIYVPQGSFVKGEMFDLNDALYSSNESYGLNFKFSAECDLTQFFIKNKLFLKNLLALKVVHKILQYMKFSQQINAVEENLKMMIIRDLEGDVDTKLTNIPSQYFRELKSVNFDLSDINSVCLPCSDSGSAPVYGSV